MPWQPTTRWEDISATLDTPLSDEAIRLLNERDRDLAKYLAISGTQTLVVYQEGMAPGTADVGTLTMPTGGTNGLAIRVFGMITQQSPFSYSSTTPPVLRVFLDDVGNTSYQQWISKNGNQPSPFSTYSWNIDLTSALVTPSGGNKYAPGSKVRIAIDPSYFAGGTSRWAADLSIDLVPLSTTPPS